MRLQLRVTYSFICDVQLHVRVILSLVCMTCSCNYVSFTHSYVYPLSRWRLIPRLVSFIFFQCLSFYYRSCHGHLPPLPSSWSLRDFFLTLIQGFVVFIQCLPLNSDFWNGVHNVDESAISSRTRDVVFFTLIARVFLDLPSLPPCS